MSDPSDKATEAEMRHRKQALENARTTKQEPSQQIVDGQVLCIDCDDPVEPGRLEAKPNAARCAHCQQIEEKYPHGRR